MRAIDDDLARAIVRLVTARPTTRRHAPAELLRFGRSAVIVVRPTRTLKQRTGAQLVPLPDGRALISFGEATSTAGLELMIADALDDRDLAPGDRAIFEAIGEILRSARRSVETLLLKRSIIVLEARRASVGPTGRTREQRQLQPATSLVLPADRPASHSPRGR